MIRVIPAATVNINYIKRNPRNNMYVGTYRIQNGKPIEFTMLFNRRRKTSTFIPALIHTDHKEYLADMILKQAGL
jgi:hypothetical protein